MDEASLIHFGLTLTSAMKKSYQRKSEDLFNIEEFNIRTINVRSTSLSTLNISAIKCILEYVDDTAKEVQREKKKRITYKEVRYELRKRKTLNLTELRKTLL